jgi:hypothetical protein
MSYAEVTVIVDGAFEESETFHDEALLSHYIAAIQDEAEGHGYPTEVYVLWHEHDDEGEECECVQYVTDHRPYASWNIEKGGS